MIGRKPKTQEELFMRILNKWKEDELTILSELGIGRKDLARKYLNDEYEEYKNLWEQLKEQKNDKQ